MERVKRYQTRQSYLINHTPIAPQTQEEQKKIELIVRPANHIRQAHPTLRAHRTHRAH